MIVRMRMGISVTVSVRISECKYTLENKAKVTDLSLFFHRRTPEPSECECEPTLHNKAKVTDPRHFCTGVPLNLLKDQ